MTVEDSPEAEAVLNREPQVPPWTSATFWLDAAASL